MDSDVEIVVLTPGASRRVYEAQILDEDDLPVNLVGGAAKLQGVSGDVTTKLNLDGTVYDGALGKVRWSGMGAMLTEAELDSKPSATFTFRIWYRDASGLEDFTDEFRWQFLPAPAVT